MPWTDILAARLAVAEKVSAFEQALEQLRQLNEYLNQKQTLSQEDSDIVDAVASIAEPSVPDVPETEA